MQRLDWSPATGELTSGGTAVWSSAREAGTEPVDARAATARRLLLTALLYAVPVIATIQPVTDPDLWWHLRTGRWIVEHAAVPWMDSFSHASSASTWVAYQWLFALLAHALHSMLGLGGVVVFKVALMGAIVVALHALIRTARPAFWLEGVLLGLATGAMLPVLAQPRSWLFSILFFILELHIVLHVRRTGNPRALLLLPPMFVIWANVHVQFLYGLFLLGLATAESVIERVVAHWRKAPPEPTRLGRWCASALLACLLAPLAGPYHVHIYRPVLDAVRLTDAFLYISELQAPAFRSLDHWLVLGLTLAAAFALGWRRSPRLFPAGLLVAGAFVSFRAHRDVWFVTVAAVVLIAETMPEASDAGRFRMTAGRAALVAASLFPVVALVAAYKVPAAKLEAAVAEAYPVAAAAIVEARGYRGPIYNHYNWGGFLIWRLPDRAVSMDGRNTLYANDHVWRSIQTWNGQPGWASDADLQSAGVVVASVKHALASLLRLDSRFELVYEDRVALVFVPRNSVSNRGEVRDGAIASAE